MINFKNDEIAKLMKVDTSTVLPGISPLLVDGESVVGAYKAARDYFIFTDKRMIAVNVQGITGKKKEFTSLPYSKIQAFSVETAGHFDFDTELELWFIGLGRIRLEFTDDSNIIEIGKFISNHIL